MAPNSASTLISASHFCLTGPPPARHTHALALPSVTCTPRPRPCTSASPVRHLHTHSNHSSVHALTCVLFLADPLTLSLSQSALVGLPDLLTHSPALSRPRCLRGPCRSLRAVSPSACPLSRWPKCVALPHFPHSRFPTSRPTCSLPTRQPTSSPAHVCDTVC